MSDKKDLQNCFLDLQRAAVSFYLHPEGKTWRIFLNHAYKILQEKKGLEKFVKQLRKIERKIVQAKRKDMINLADEILTLGILLKP